MGLEWFYLVLLVLNRVLFGLTGFEWDFTGSSLVLFDLTEFYCVLQSLTGV